jgi:hypothetical protein
MNNCSINQILKLWSELEDCYHNSNGFGGNVAEIYAYTLRQESPAHIHLRTSMPDCGVSSEIYGDDIIQENLDTGSALVHFCKKFAKDKKCSVFIEGRDCFLEELKSFSFDHRIHISVKLDNSKMANLKSYIENINNLRTRINEDHIQSDLSKLTKRDIDSIIVSLESNLAPEDIHSSSDLSENAKYYKKVHAELCIQIGREIKLEY